MPEDAQIIIEYEDLMEEFRPTVGNNDHIWIVHTIGQIEMLKKERDGAGTAKKKRIDTKILSLKSHAVWLLRGKPKVWK